jgi:O-antigen ligase
VSIVGLAMLGVVAAGALVLLETVIRRTDVGAGLVLALLLLDEANLIETAIDIGPVRVQATDVVLLLLLAAGVARLLRTDRLTTAQWLLIVFGVLTIWALVRGTSPFGVPAAVNEARKFLGFGAVALYFATAQPRRDLMERIGNLLLLAAAILAVFTLVRWVAGVAGMSGGFFGRDDDLRVLPASLAFLIAQAAIVAFPYIIDRAAGWRRLIAPALLVLVVLLQHRTVWVATAVGAALLFYRERALARRALTVLLMVVGLLAALSFTLFDDPDVQLGDQLSSSAQSTATFEWRYEGWRALLTDSGPEGPGEVVVGKPFGGGWGRTLPNGLRIENHISPHNFYLETFLRVGVLGLAILLALYVLVLRGLMTRSDRVAAATELLSPHVLGVVIALQLLYYITYTPDLSQVMLLGLGCAAVSRQTRTGHGSRGGAQEVSTGWAVRAADAAVRPSGRG